jgi:16S rRNA processing protein RimM
VIFLIQYLKVGQIINTHGIKGEVKVYPLTDDIRRFKKLKFVLIKNHESYDRYDIDGVKFVKDLPILKLSKIDSMNDAEKYKNQYLYIDRENAVKLPEDSYFIADLIGLKVITQNNEVLGELVSVLPTGSNDVYEIKKEDGKTFLIPAIGEVILKVDIENRIMIINLLEGLI